MPATEEEVREMLALLDQYKYRVDMLSQQLNVLTANEVELGAAWEFLQNYGEVEEGSDVLIPVGGGVLVTAKAVRPDTVISAIGSDYHAEMDPKKAAEAIGEQRDRVREMIQQIKAGIEQTEQSAMALQQQAEVAFNELQQTRGATI
jgi:prefoldin alpha subunit